MNFQPPDIAPETHSAALSKWPELDASSVHPMSGAWLEYERARAEAYKCRLELAVGALRDVLGHVFYEDYQANAARERAYKALAAIGPLP